MLRTIKYLFIPAISLLLTVIIYNWINENYLQKQEVVKEEAKSEEVLIGGPFELVNQYGDAVKNTDFIGKYMLVYFGFSNCPMICPTDMANMTIAIEELGLKQKSMIQPIFITIDPERDDSEQLKIFASNYSDNLLALTGTAQQIANAANNYRIYYKKVESEELQDYLMDHSSYMYLMGKDGKYITHFRSDQAASEIANGLKKNIR